MDDKRKQTLKLINSYSSPHSILVINVSGKLYRIYCPFKVKAIKSTTYFKSGQVLMVTKVSTNTNLEIIYTIKGIWFNHSWFIIIGFG